MSANLNNLPSYCDEPFKTLDPISIENSERLRSHDAPSTTDTLLVKRGYRDLTSDLTCGVLFETDPVWLWSLRPNSWITIYITGSDELILRQDHPILFELLSSKLSVIPSTFRNDFPSVAPDCMWISRSRNFFEMVEFGGCGTHVFWLSHSPRRVPIDMEDICWSKILHRNVGGVTEARGTFGASAGSPLIKLERDLQRSLGHIVKYAVRPRVCDPQPVESH